jgi:hypothetical protein
MEGLQRELEDLQRRHPALLAGRSADLGGGRTLLGRRAGELLARDVSNWGYFWERAREEGGMGSLVAYLDAFEGESKRLRAALQALCEHIARLRPLVERIRALPDDPTLDRRHLEALVAHDPGTAAGILDSLEHRSRFTVLAEEVLARSLRKRLALATEWLAAADEEDAESLLGDLAEIKGSQDRAGARRYRVQLADLHVRLDAVIRRISAACARRTFNLISDASAPAFQEVERRIDVRPAHQGSGLRMNQRFRKGLAQLQARGAPPDLSIVRGSSTSDVAVAWEAIGKALSDGRPEFGDPRPPPPGPLTDEVMLEHIAVPLFEYASAPFDELYGPGALRKHCLVNGALSPERLFEKLSYNLMGPVGARLGADGCYAIKTLRDFAYALNAHHATDAQRRTVQKGIEMLRTLMEGGGWWPEYQPVSTRG